MSEDKKYLKQFEVVAMGCNERAHAQLRDLFEEMGVYTYVFVEYFFLKPIFKIESHINHEDKDIFFPFVRRLLSSHSFLAQEPKDGGPILMPRTKGIQNEYKTENFIYPMRHTVVGKEVYKKWSDNEEIYYDEEYDHKAWANYLEQQASVIDIKKRKIFIQEYNLMMRSFSMSPVTSVMLGYPIASNSIFYGYFILLFPRDDGESAPTGESAPMIGTDQNKSILRRLLKDLSYNIYLPTLLLLHETHWEKEVKEKLSDIINSYERDNSVGKERLASIVPLLHNDFESDDLMEKALHDLWGRRDVLLSDKNMYKEKKKDALEKTLLFNKYYLASPQMIEQIKRIMKAGPRLHPPEDNGKPLPTALVYGEPGTGKEIMSQLISLFSNSPGKNNRGIISQFISLFSNYPRKHNQEGYFGCPQYVVNMASLKPNALVGPLLLGLKPKTFQFELDSVFTPGNGNQAMVYIFDELNSLDLDLQGILLRILENGEITPLFDFKTKQIKHLVIGVVNEDPDEITRESEFRSLKEMENFFGKMIGAYLYDSIGKSRKLRLDLYYRLKRNLYVRMPVLSDRREDIPILFKYFCDLEAIEIEVNIDYEVYTMLMDRGLTWPGNVRQLQAVAKDCVQTAIEKQSSVNMPKGVQEIDITRTIIKDVLQGHFKHLFDSYSNLKDKRR